MSDKHEYTSKSEKYIHVIITNLVIGNLDIFDYQLIIDISNKHPKFML